MCDPLQLSTTLPNYRSFCDTNSQKVVLLALTILAAGGLSLGLVGHFNLIPSSYQWLGGSLFSVTFLYPTGAGIAYLIYRRFNSDVDIESCLKELDKKWNKTGTLQFQDNFIYVKVDNGPFQDFYEALKKQNPNLQLPSERGSKPVGMHVSVLSGRDRMELQKLENIKKNLHTQAPVTFEILEYKSVAPPHLNVAKYHVIQVKATNLEELRESWGLPRKQSILTENNEEETIDFHVTIGQEPSEDVL